MFIVIKIRNLEAYELLHIQREWCLVEPQGYEDQVEVHKAGGYNAREFGERTRYA